MKQEVDLIGWFKLYKIHWKMFSKMGAKEDYNEVFFIGGLNKMDEDVFLTWFNFCSS